MGLTNSMIRLIVKNGSFNMERLSNLFFIKDNDGCPPEEIGDLLDFQSILADAIGEYEASACEDTGISQEDAIRNALKLGMIKLFFQVYLVEYYLKNNLLQIINCNIILISTINEKNEPNVSYAPTYIDSQCNFYIYISTLAKHTKNILGNNKLSFMAMEENSPNIFAKKRITFNGKIKIIDRKSDTFNTLMDKIKKVLDK